MIRKINFFALLRLVSSPDNLEQCDSNRLLIFFFVLFVKKGEANYEQGTLEEEHCSGGESYSAIAFSGT